MKRRTAPKKKLQNWEREDRLLDYIAGHKKELIRYFAVALLGELEKYLLLYNFLYPLFPFMLKADMSFTFVLWGLPYFFLCKNWVWKDRTNAYTTAAKAMRFSMFFILIYLFIGSLLMPLLTRLLTLGIPAAKSIAVLTEEVLYFFVMFRYVIRPNTK